jgi:HD-like signal output (HDOD) protein
MIGTDDLLEQVVKVCPLPAATQQVLALTSSESSSIPQVARVISKDPALAASVLSVANSAAYGMGKIDRLEVAVMRLGLRELHSLAAAMALFAAFRNQAELSLSLHELGVVSGSIAHTLAKETGVAEPGSAFVCGLLSEIGAMACLAFDGKDYVRIYQAAGADHVARRELEEARYSASSAQIGRRFLERNSLPENLCSAVGCELEQAEASAPLGKVTLLARHTPSLLRHLKAEPELQLAALETLAAQVALETIDGASLLSLWTRATSVR